MEEGRNLINLKVKQNAHLTAFENWELIKIDMQEFFKEKGKVVAGEDVEKIKSLKLVFDGLMQETLTEENVPDKYLDEVKAKIEVLENKQVESAIFRSRAKWNLEGEKSSKYFYSLEKCNYNAKVMSKLMINGSLCTEQKNILEEQRKFYQILYTQNIERKFNILNTSAVKLTIEQVESLETPITEAELQKAMLDMKGDKTPGLDGLPVEFYRCYWNELSNILYQVYESAYQGGRLNDTARQGVILLLPKGSKNPLFLKNWRPLTLLNLDYKILAKALAGRLKSVLPDLIGPQQTGFMEGRQISENIRKTIDVITYVNKKKQNCLIMTIDF